MRGFLWVCDELPIVVKLQGEGGDIPHDLDTVVYVVPGNIGHHPVDKHLGQESADAGIQEHHSVQRTKLTSPSGQINNSKIKWNSRVQIPDLELKRIIMFFMNYLALESLMPVCLSAMTNQIS